MYNLKICLGFHILKNGSNNWINSGRITKNDKEISIKVTDFDRILSLVANSSFHRKFYFKNIFILKKIQFENKLPTLKILWKSFIIATAPLHKKNGALNPSVQKTLKQEGAELVQQFFSNF